ncbi:exo-alpha-sialidase [Thalassotalea fonticola]|uniref:Exo-alpha-sialidase n=1 Tax=Thalassotalea fonticola TaxID=3065649 RepID=A0ABZ0GTT3_9GAMM|nr:exo-alpha-sialidase [Colwelliaceae bacterium S1-1]
MNLENIITRLIQLTIAASFLLTNTVNASEEHQHMKHKESVQNQSQQCDTAEIRCAKTVTSAFAPNGDLWRLWSHEQRLYYQVSTDKGLSFSATRQVSNIKEKISARNENRPKIAFDNANGVYLSWATPKQKKYTADIRFSYSSDYGEHFSTVLTVNNDNLLTGHSFNELHVSANGEVSIVWLDGRLAYELRKQGKTANGSALFIGQANPSKNKTEFSNQQLANGTCVCCRIALDANPNGDLAIFWRHIFGDNIREFALLTLGGQQKPALTQISHDHWQINGCPHQGGGLSIDKNNRYHMVWFNQGDKGKGIFYASSIDAGKSLTTPLHIGELSGQASHPHVIQNQNKVDIVWTQFNGIEHQLWLQSSTDNGKTFAPAKQLAQSKFGADRPFLIKHGNINYVSWQRPKQGHWISAI